MEGKGGGRGVLLAVEVELRSPQLSACVTVGTTGGARAGLLCGLRSRGW